MVNLAAGHWTSPRPCCTQGYRSPSQPCYSRVYDVSELKEMSLSPNAALRLHSRKKCQDINMRAELQAGMRHWGSTRQNRNNTGHHTTCLGTPSLPPHLDTVAERWSSALPGYSDANTLLLLQPFASHHSSCSQQSCSHWKEKIQ